MTTPGRRRIVVAVVALALALPGAWLDARQFLAAWLVAFWYCLGLMLGALASVWIHRLTGGSWGLAMRPVAFACARHLPWLLLLSLPVILGAGQLYPWVADPSGGWAEPMARAAFPRAWLDPTFALARVVGYAAVFGWLCRPRVVARKGGAAAALAAYIVVGSLASVDVLMSLVPGWFSTAFGLVVLSGQALGGAALVVLVLARGAGPRDAAQPPPWRDLGNLLLMWTMTWAYVAFMEFLVIWAENIPRETAWYLPRLATGWRWSGLALLVLQFGLPLLCLLWRSVKDDPRRLRGVATLLLVMQGLNTAWLVLPSVQPHGILGWWLVPLLTLAMALPLLGPAWSGERIALPESPSAEKARHAAP